MCNHGLGSPVGSTTKGVHMDELDEVTWLWRLAMLLLRIQEWAARRGKREQPKPNSEPRRKKSNGGKRKPNKRKPKKPRTTKQKR